MILFPYAFLVLPPQDYLNDIAVDPVRSKLCKQRVLCRTLAGNLVYVLTITTPTKTPEDMKVCVPCVCVCGGGVCVCVCADYQHAYQDT